MSEMQPEVAKKDYDWEQPASKEEQQEYERVLKAISRVVYEDDRTFAGIEKMLKGPEPVDSTVRATIMVITEVDKKIDIPMVVLPQLPFIVFDMLEEVGEKAGIFKMSDEQSKVGRGAAQETLLRTYGFSEEDFMAATDGLGEKDVNELVGAYQEVTSGKGFAKKGA